MLERRSLLKQQQWSVGDAVYCPDISPMVSRYGTIDSIDDADAVVRSDGGFIWRIPFSRLKAAEEREKTHPGERDA